MITAATLMHRIPARALILLLLLLAAVTVVIAAFHGVPVHGHEAMYHDGEGWTAPNMYHD